MRVTQDHIESFMLKIARTRPSESSCDDCAKHAARLVDALIQGDVEDQELLDILHHVLMCIPCGQEIRILHQCAQMDAMDAWPSPDEMWHKIERGE